MDFEQKFLKPSYIPLIFEIVPPGLNANKKDINFLLSKIYKTTQIVNFDAFNIPDLIYEKGLKKGHAFKIAPRDFAILIKKRINIPLIINRVTVFKNKKQQKKWLLESWQNYQIKNLILVGAPDNKDYPGLSVCQMAKLVSQLNKQGFTKINCGAITISTRRNEPGRMIKKQKAGVKFFLSQIIYDAKTTCQLLKKYQLICLKEKLKPVRIILSFSPAMTISDLDFLESLRVYIPAKLKKQFRQMESDIPHISILQIQKIITDIFTFCHEQQIKIPLGINIAYLRFLNYDLSLRLVKIILSIIENFPRL